jgi:AbrB family looped-hinge helix DNA binding protein
LKDSAPFAHSASGAFLCELALFFLDGKDSFSGKEIAMPYSTITRKGQTTLPLLIREALHLQPGDRISYEVLGDSVVIRAQPGVMALFGALSPSVEMAGRPFSEAREQARKAWVEGATEVEPR